MCQKCGVQTSRWQGRCFACGEWNSLMEVATSESKKDGKINFDLKAVAISELEQLKIERISTNDHEVDQVLGDGLVPGSVVLIGGEPGIGKSTLLLQILGRIKTQKGSECLYYLSAEESVRQLKLRSQRLKITREDLFLISEQNVDAVLGYLNNQLVKIKVLVIDSIQTLKTDDLSSPAGSIAQVQECARRLINFAKSEDTVVILVGHITKGGYLAGPKTLEHLVDAVLYLEGDKLGEYRVLRSLKNRFGSINEVGIFKMVETGLSQVEDISKEILAQRAVDVPGSVVTVALEGQRLILLELQALTTPTNFGYPRRIVNGIDYNRALMLLAVLQKRAGINFNNQDVYLNVSGGLTVKEPALDLAVCLSLASSLKGKPLPSDLAAFGEVGLLGEIKNVSRENDRIKEAKRFGFKTILSRKSEKSLGLVTQKLF